MNHDLTHVSVIDFHSVGDHIDHSLELVLPGLPFGVNFEEAFGAHFVMDTGVVLEDSDRAALVPVDVFGQRSVLLDDLSREKFELVRVRNSASYKHLLVSSQPFVLIGRGVFPLPDRRGAVQLFRGYCSPFGKGTNSRVDQSTMHPRSWRALLSPAFQALLRMNSL